MRAYSELLRLDDLLPLIGSRPSAPDSEALEMRFFLAIHQAHELWFSLVIADLEVAREALLAVDLERAVPSLRRCGAAAEVLTAQLRALALLPRDAFQLIRKELGVASGLQSVQYREIEYMCGLREGRYVQTPGFGAEQRARLEARLAEPSLADVFRSTVIPLAREIAIDQAAKRDDHDSFVGTVQALRRFDLGMYEWRAEHVRIAEHFIGDERGTGGSEGVAYLEKRVELDLFGETVTDLVELIAKWHDPRPAGGTGM